MQVQHFELLLLKHIHTRGRAACYSWHQNNGGHFSLANNDSVCVPVIFYTGWDRNVEENIFYVCIFYFIDSLSRICHILIIVRPSDFSDLSYPSSPVPGSVYVQYLMWWERYGGIKIMLWRCRIWWKSLLKLFTVCYSPHATAARGGGQQKLDTMVEFSVQNAQYAEYFLVFSSAPLPPIFPLNLIKLSEWI